MKPSRPSVRSGVSSGGSAATISAAIRVALTSLSFAQPGCASTPWMVTITCSPLNVSSCSSPRSEPSSVYAQTAPKRLDVEQRRALADLLVGGEADAQRRARQVRVGRQVRDRGHDLGHAGLVVGAEQRVAAGGHDVVARRAPRPPCRCAAARSASRRGRGARSARRSHRAHPDSCPRGRSGRSPARRRRASRSRSRCRRARRRPARSPAARRPAGATRSSWPGVLGDCVRSRADCVSMRT